MCLSMWSRRQKDVENGKNIKLAVFMSLRFPIEWFCYDKRMYGPMSIYPRGQSTAATLRVKGARNKALNEPKKKPFT